ncbi:MAG TPA: hypothetical protein VFB73_11620 [Chloroflexota bacterium]|nr:hypothetical protein [Chloroflexota bacterium]
MGPAAGASKPPGDRRPRGAVPRPAGGGRYVQELGAVLRRRDPLALQAFLVASARRFGNEREASELERRSPAEMELLLHRMILARPDLRDLHADSQRWLRAHGHASAGPEGAGGAEAGR